MDNRDTLLGARVQDQDVRFLELDLRDINARQLLGQRGQLKIGTKLVFKTGEDHRKVDSVFLLWAEVQVSTQAGQTPLDLGRAVIRDPVFFSPEQPAGRIGDPWTRVVDHLVLDLDYRQLDEIETKRQGGPLTFWFAVGGTIYHDGRLVQLYPGNHQLTYEVGGSTWIQLLAQLGYGSYLNLEVPLTSPNGVTKEVRQAAQALQEAVAAFLRGGYAETVSDCRPGLEALLAADQDKQSDLKPWDPKAGWDQRFSWLQVARLKLTHLAHHPNDPAAIDSPGPTARGRPNRLMPRWSSRRSPH